MVGMSVAVGVTVVAVTRLVVVSTSPVILSVDRSRRVNHDGDNVSLSDDDSVTSEMAVRGLRPLCVGLLVIRF